jgi:hypothetical protein
MEMEMEIKETFYQAFKDKLKETLASPKPDCEWITRLYKEIKDRLQRLVRPTNPLYNTVDENLDPEFFHQMLEHGVFQGPEFVRLLNFTFDLLLKLGAPARDVFVNQQKQEILNCLTEQATLAEIVPKFIIRVNQIIDLIYLDIADLKKNIDSVK